MHMRVTYVGPFDEVEIPSLGIAVKRNEAVDVPDDVGHDLVAQTDWQTAVLFMPSTPEE
jgi:hypothetical protein